MRKLLRCPLRGEVFGKVTVLSAWENTKFDGEVSSRKSTLCVCECGTFFVTKNKSLLSGNCESCGCARYLVKRTPPVSLCTKTKGQRDARRIWAGMKDRCFNIKNRDWHLYGGRGITVCEEWLDFDTFYLDMGDRPKGFSIERLDVHGNYCKENCVWEDNIVQSQNRRMRITNKSGREGVHKHTKGDKWVATCGFNNNRVITYHDSFEEACAAREKYEEERKVDFENYKRARSEANP